MMNREQQLRLQALGLAMGRYPPTMSDEDERVIATAERFLAFIKASPAKDPPKRHSGLT